MPKININFTKSTLNKLETSKQGRNYYQDIKEKGLSLYITTNNIKTFYIRKNINGKDIKFTIGNYPDVSIENARKKALQIKSQIAEGVNPKVNKECLEEEITLHDLSMQYIERYAKIHKKTWQEDQKNIDRILTPLFKYKISTISKEKIQLLHEKIGENNGYYMANRILALLSSIYNKAIEWGFQGINPCIGIKKFKEKSRDRFIQQDELPRFFKSLEEESNYIVRDYIYISLYTGARKSNVLSMKWEDINFSSNQWRIEETKNGESITVPLLEEAVSILKDIKKTTQSKWVFPSKTSKSGHIEEPKKVWSNILKRANINNLRIHDIRRTLGSYQAISGSSLLVIGKSLGHKSTSATAIYSRLNLDPVRESMKVAVGAMQDYKNGSSDEGV